MTLWCGPDGEAVEAPEPPPAGSYYGPIGDFQGAQYERNAFTLGTAQEVEFLTEALDLSPGDRLLDVGCGTGRHTRALRRLGVEAVGLDLSLGLLRAGAGADAGTWLQADARHIPLRDASFDAVISLCQGGFGITPGGDATVLAEMARVLRPGGRLALTAFSLVFAARWFVAGEALDVDRGLHWTPADVRGADGAQQRFDLWTQCYSAGHLRCLAHQSGLVVDGLHGVEPGDYGRRDPALRDPELLLLAHRPG